jgi:DNA-directed RNA polymerase specialized sigma24 family protein
VRSGGELALHDRSQHAGQEFAQTRGRGARERCVGIRDAVSFGSEELDRVEALAGSNSDLGQLLGRLPSEQADAFRARVLGERDYSDIAAELRTSELVIRKRVSRGLAALRQEVEKENQ